MAITTEVIDCGLARSPREAFARDVRRGLSRRPKSLSSAWFYDDRGSELFEQITQLEEYYLTRCEREILERYASEIAISLRGEPFRILEIGAGDGHKTEILLREFLAQGLEFEYVPIDICHRSIIDLVAKLRRSIYGSFAVRGIVADYHDALGVMRSHLPMRNFVLFLGSSIGNFDHASARRFLRDLRRSLKPGDQALLGFDLKKDPSILQRAYDDSAGVTREFNLNLLDRINRELSGQFDRRRFLHHATYNAAQSCMESWLVSRERHSVPIGALESSFAFAAWEAIRVERSYKYDSQLIASLATATGFSVTQQFRDCQCRFLDSLWMVE